MNELYTTTTPTDYYGDEFQRMHDSETYVGKFNWVAFFWAGPWALVHGLWHILGLMIVILAVASLVGTPFAGAVASFGIAFWLGFRGNHVFYRKRLKNERAWI